LNKAHKKFQENQSPSVEVRIFISTNERRYPNYGLILQNFTRSIRSKQDQLRLTVTRWFRRRSRIWGL